MQHQHIKKPEQAHDSDSDPNSAKQVYIERLNAQPVGIPLYLQRSQTQLLQQQPLEEEEEELQTKCENCAVHDQVPEGEETTLQEKSDNDVAQQHQQNEQALQKKPAHHSLQAKLKIGAPNDKCEQETDRVADEVMRMPDSTVQRQTDEEEEKAVQAKFITPFIQRQPEPEEDEEVMKKQEDEEKEKTVETIRTPHIQMSSGDHSNYASPDMSRRLASAKWSGQPLPQKLSRVRL